MTDAPSRPRSGGRWRVVVCGTRFGRIYLSGLRQAADRYELAGVLARGSERSRACADRYGVPLFTDLDQVPEDVDIACVVVGTAINGGPGAQLAEAFLNRGTHVLQEHPVHPDELAGCLRVSRRTGAAYQLNTHYVHVEPVRRFLDAAARLADKQPPLFIDALGGIQVTFSLLELIARAAGRLRPAGFAELAELPAELARMAQTEFSYRSVDGVVGGVPVRLGIQNQLDPADPDNHAHLLHRITVGFDGGLLTLAGTHGPVLWSPRAHLPRSSAELAELADAPEPYLDLPSSEPFGPATAASYRDIVGTLWPKAVTRALDQLVQAITGQRDARSDGQFYLSVCQLWQQLTRRLGPPELHERSQPEPLPIAALGGQHTEPPQPATARPDGPAQSDLAGPAQPLTTAQTASVTGPEASAPDELRRPGAARRHRPSFAHRRTGATSGLLRCFEPRPLPSCRLVCFPHAGGTAGFFRRWSAALPASAELTAVQYPGREDRMSVPFPESLDELVDDVVQALHAFSGDGLVLFGHSMGAAVAYEAAQRLTQLGRPPRLLAVSARPAPHRQRVETVHLGGDEAILADLRRLGGTAAALLEDPALRQLVLPSLRADYRLIEQYWPTAALPTLSCPVAAFSATEDTEATQEEMAAWADVTTGEFASRTFPGDHFYLRDGAPVVAELMRMAGNSATAAAGWPSTP